MFNPTAHVFAPGNAYHGTSRLLALPIELRERIADFALRPRNALEIGRPYADIAVRAIDAHQALTTWLRPFKACKALYEIALDVYFRNNRPNMVVGRDITKDHERVHGSSDNEYSSYSGEILYGTFEAHAFFFQHTTKLRIELQGYDEDVAVKTCGILASCSALKDVRVCVLNLDAKHRPDFYNQVVDTINAMMKRTGRHIILAKETSEQYDLEMSARQQAMDECERSEEEEGRAVDAWGRSGDGESFEEYMNAASYEESYGAS